MNTPLDAVSGKHYWRSLDELADSDHFRTLVEREFPAGAAEMSDAISRRRFLTLMGASLALAGIAGCNMRPAEQILPYVKQPEELIPGKPLFYATAMTLAGYATGLLVQSREGRPIKVEGNPDHPASLGATDVFAQASLLGLYDPDRAQGITYLGRPRSFDGAVNALRTALDKQKKTGGDKVRILTEAVSSPSLTAQLNGLLKELPAAKWHVYEPASRDAVRRGAEMALDADVLTRYRFDKASVILSLDADFLTTGPGHVVYARQFIDRRRVSTGQVEMNRLYAVECAYTATGAKADHRLPFQAGRVEAFARALAVELQVLPGTAPDLPEKAAKWVKVVAADLRKNKGAGIVIPGDHQPPAVHAIAHALNYVLGNVGQTIVCTDPVEARPPAGQTGALEQLAEDMEQRQVDVLLILGGNPVYTAPSDVRFGERLEKVPLRLHLGPYSDETAYLCQWHIPEAHYLESWGDARAFDGTVSIVQPLIEPLFGGRTAQELLASITQQTERSALEVVKGHWRRTWTERNTSGDFEAVWQKTLHDGVMPDTQLPPRTVSLRGDWAAQLPAPAAPGTGPEIVFRLDPTVYDGRFANNGWLQELPKPLTKLTWGNAVLMSPKTASSRELNLNLKDRPAFHGGEHGEVIATVVELTYKGRTIQAPVLIQPGHADDSVTVHLGYGRKRAGKVGTDVGFNATELRSAGGPAAGFGLEIKQTNKRMTLACTQFHHWMNGRDIIRAGDLEEYHKDPHKPATPREIGHTEKIELPMAEAAKPEKPKESGVEKQLFPEYPHKTPHQWGMAIDLTACVGCNACIVACQAENNIPVVGKDQVTRGREMHWLRIDTYFEGMPVNNQVPENPPAHFQPVPCMHCENAPCELVCPVEATVHSDDGLNDMVYNRCVGTRYCSNNCPYKVRRFNFLEFANFTTPTLKLLRNPEVTVRSRGVMEKCTYCVQRIRSALIETERQHRPLADGEVVTACQAACPAGAIVFGNINDDKSQVAKWKATPLNYGLLDDELNTRPRTTYLAGLRNPNSALGND